MDLRTPQEIVERIKAKQSQLLNFEPEVLGRFVRHEHIKPLLAEGVTAAEWDEDVTDYTVENVIAQAREYMAAYGWPKALGHRGISAGRTIQKMTAWAWLACDEKALQIIRDTPYPQYGVPILWALCEHWAFPIPTSPMSYRMAHGRPCIDNCTNGCES